VPGRGNRAEPDRRRHWHCPRVQPGGGHVALDVVAGESPRECGGHGVRLRSGDGRLLRLLSGAEGGAPRSDRCASIRMTGPPTVISIKNLVKTYVVGEVEVRALRSV